MNAKGVTSPMRDPASETTPAEAMWAVWSTMPDPATVVRSLIPSTRTSRVSRQERWRASELKTSSSIATTRPLR